MGQPTNDMNVTNTFRSSKLHDTIWVQKRRNILNDDEEHEENPHLQDFLVPSFHASVNIEERQEQSLTLATPTSNERPKLTRPCKSSLHHVDCSTRNVCQVTEAKRCHVGFKSVTVRDYGVILGDHPNCSYGPPVMLGWDYLEYEPLSIDEYEIHHSRRRPLKSMVLSYYRRKDLICKHAGQSKDEIKLVMKELDRTKAQRNITSHLLPLRKVEDVFESGFRKLKRTFKKKQSSTSE